MPRVVYRLSVVSLFLVSGCASPIFSGLSRNFTSSSGAANDRGVDAAPTERLPKSASTGRTPSDGRTATGLSPASDQRVSELLAGAAFSQRARKLTEARSAYEQVLRIDPRNMTANYQLAVIADDEGRFSDARQYYFALLKQSPHNPDILASLGWSYLLQGRYDDCESALRDALQYSPAHQTALYNLGWLYGTRGDDEYALALFRKAGTEAEAQRALAELQQTRPSASPIPGSSPNSLLATRERAAAGGVSAPMPWNTEPRGGVPRGPSRSSNIFSEVDAVASTSPAQANRERLADPQSIVIRPGAPRPPSNGAQSGHVSWNTDITETRPGSDLANDQAAWPRNQSGAVAPADWRDPTSTPRPGASPEIVATPRTEPDVRPETLAAAAQLGLSAGQACPIVSSPPPTAGAQATVRAVLAPPVPTDVIPLSETVPPDSQPAPPGIYPGRSASIPVRQ